MNIVSAIAAFAENYPFSTVVIIWCVIGIWLAIRYRQTDPSFAPSHDDITPYELPLFILRWIGRILLWPLRFFPPTLDS